MVYRNVGSSLLVSQVRFSIVYVMLTGRDSSGFQMKIFPTSSRKYWELNLETSFHMQNKCSTPELHPFPKETVKWVDNSEPRINSFTIQALVLDINSLQWIVCPRQLPIFFLALSKKMWSTIEFGIQQAQIFIHLYFDALMCAQISAGLAFNNLMLAARHFKYSLTVATLFPSQNGAKTKQGNTCLLAHYNHAPRSASLVKVSIQEKVLLLGKVAACLPCKVSSW